MSCLDDAGRAEAEVELEAKVEVYRLVPGFGGRAIATVEVGVERRASRPDLR